MDRLSDERNVPHLATRANCALTVEMEYRARNIQQSPTACTLHKRRGIVSDEVHHDGGTQ